MDQGCIDCNRRELMLLNEGDEVFVEKLLYSLEETRTALGGISLSTLYNLRRRGRLKILKLGARSFCDRKEIEQLVADMPKRSRNQGGTHSTESETRRSASGEINRRPELIQTEHT